MFIKGFSRYEKVWFVLFCGIGIALSVLWHETFIGFIAFLSGIICVLLAAKGMRLNYIVGIVNCLAYGYVSYKSGLFGETMLNLAFYLPMQFVGFYLWKKKTDENGIVEMKKLSLKKLGFSIMSCLIFVIAYGIFLNTLQGQNTPFVDSATNVLSVVAAILMMLRYREYWGFYIFVNGISVYMWVLRFASHQQDSLTMVVMWAAYLINSVYGFYIWYGMGGKKDGKSGALLG